MQEARQAPRPRPSSDPQFQFQSPSEVLLDPAGLLRFLRVMRPELGPGEVRYVMDHLLQVGGGGLTSGREWWGRHRFMKGRGI